MWILVAAALATCPAPDSLVGFEVTPARDYRVADLPVEITVTAVDADGNPVQTFCGEARLEGVSREDAHGNRVPVETTGGFVAGVVKLDKVYLADEVRVTHDSISTATPIGLRHLPGFLSLMPPLIAIALAIIARRALIALFAGIWLGAVFVYGWNPWTALMRVFDTHLPGQLADSGHAAIILFTLALGGMVGVIGRSGGSQALVNIMSKRARTRRSGMLTAWISGMVVFFDDYANCLLVGNTVRPFTDERRISREKLSFIVDSTAAPVATIAVVSTWIGYQLGLLDEAGVPLRGNAYDTFLSMLPYSFYAIFCMAFVGMIAWSQRDFGPMLTAERRAIETGALVRPGGQPLMDKSIEMLGPSPDTPLRWQNALFPIIAVIAVVVVGLYISGSASSPDDAGLREIIGNADSYAVLLWASFLGSLVALVMCVGTRAASVGDAMDAWISGVKSMVMAVLILVLAWGIGDICKTYLQTGPWLLSQVSPSAHWLPVITFVVSAVIALATGSSFSTMAIVIPIAAPMIWEVTGEGSGIDIETAWAARHATLAAVLSGAVFGDHCSPISDTTIMSSMASAADHIDHVRTQMPYAGLIAGVAGLFGFVPAGFGISPLISLPIGIGVLAATVFFLGKRADMPVTD